MPGSCSNSSACRRIRATFENRSRTTWESAVNTYALVKLQLSEFLDTVDLGQSHVACRGCLPTARLDRAAVAGRLPVSRPHQCLRPIYGRKAPRCWTGRYMDGSVWPYNHAGPDRRVPPGAGLSRCLRHTGYTPNQDPHVANDPPSLHQLGGKGPN